MNGLLCSAGLLRCSEEVGDERDGDEDDDDPFEDLHPARALAVCEFLVDIFGDRDFAVDGGVPLWDAESLCGERVDASEVLVPQEFECVACGFCRDCGVDLECSDSCEFWLA